MSDRDESSKSPAQPQPQNAAPAKPVMPPNRIIKGNDPPVDAFTMIDRPKKS